MEHFSERRGTGGSLFLQPPLEQQLSGKFALPSIPLVDAPGARETGVYMAARSDRHGRHAPTRIRDSVALPGSSQHIASRGPATSAHGEVLTDTRTGRTGQPAWGLTAMARHQTPP